MSPENMPPILPTHTSTPTQQLLKKLLSDTKHSAMHAFEFSPYYTVNIILYDTESNI